MCLDFLAFSFPFPPLIASYVLPYFRRFPWFSCDSVYLRMVEIGQCQPLFPWCLLPQLNQAAAGLCFQDVSSHSSNCSHKEYICLLCQHLEKLWWLQLMIHVQSPDISKCTRQWKGRNSGHQNSTRGSVWPTPTTVFPKEIQQKIFLFLKINL